MSDGRSRVPGVGPVVVRRPPELARRAVESVEASIRRPASRSSRRGSAGRAGDRDDLEQNPLLVGASACESASGPVCAATSSLRPLDAGREFALARVTSDRPQHDRRDHPAVPDLDAVERDRDARRAKMTTPSRPRSRRLRRPPAQGKSARAHHLAEVGAPEHEDSDAGRASPTTRMKREHVRCRSRVGRGTSAPRRPRVHATRTRAPHRDDGGEHRGVQRQVERIVQARRQRRSARPRRRRGARPARGSCGPGGPRPRRSRPSTRPARTSASTRSPTERCRAGRPARSPPRRQARDRRRRAAPPVARSAAAARSPTGAPVASPPAGARPQRSSRRRRGARRRDAGTGSRPRSPTRR